jgi:hypothetical protein
MVSYIVLCPWFYWAQVFSCPAATFKASFSIPSTLVTT